MERCRCDRIPQSIRFAPGRSPTYPCTNAICATNKRHLYGVRMPTYQSSLYDLKKLRPRTFEYQILRNHHKSGVKVMISTHRKVTYREVLMIPSSFFPMTIHDRLASYFPHKHAAFSLFFCTFALSTTFIRQSI